MPLSPLRTAVYAVRYRTCYLPVRSDNPILAQIQRRPKTAVPELLSKNRLPPPAIFLVATSVADPVSDPGPGAFLPLVPGSGSGSGNQEEKNPDPGSGMKIPDLILRPCYSVFWGVKNACRSATLVVTEYFYSDRYSTRSKKAE